MTSQTSTVAKVFGQLPSLWTEKVSPLAKQTGAVLALSFLLGGGTRPGFLGDVILQFLAILLLLSALWRLGDQPAARSGLWGLIFVLALLCVPVVQLVPLPSSWWAGLPGRDQIQAALRLVGQEPAATSLSVSPSATALSALSLLIPVAIFVSTLMLTHRERRLLSLVIVAMGLVSAVLGLLQVAQGPSSGLRFYAFTNPTEAVGFFANRNHFAALLYATLLLVTVWFAELVSQPVRGTDRTMAELGVSRNVLVTVGALTMVALLSAEVMARSRAGLALTTLALLGAVPLMLASGRLAGKSHMGRVVIGAMAMAAIFALQIGFYRVVSRFEADPLEDARWSMWQNTSAAAQVYMPFGSGLGTFTQVYPLFEKREDLVDDTIANHAHNDFLELWLEAGILAPVLVGSFVIWLVIATAMAWRRQEHQVALVDRLLPRAAALILALLVLHSAVDYPLRTSALLALFAFCCALLFTPSLQHLTKEQGPAQDHSVALAPQPAHEMTPAFASFSWPAEASEPGSAQGTTPDHGQTWGRGVAWPDEWRAVEPTGDDKG